MMLKGCNGVYAATSVKAANLFVCFSTCLSGCFLGVPWLGHVAAVRAQAQVIPDLTLPQASTVLLQPGGRLEIEGGTLAGSNLFHSFSEFSIAAGEIAQFQVSPTVNNILTRVTGGQTSQINGQIAVNTPANFFLINPQGISFGPEAELNLGGSFVASTAETLTFADGREFSAIAPNSQALLSISTPTGLQFGSSQFGSPQLGTSQFQTTPAPVEVLGNGNRLGVNPVTGEIVREDRPPGLAVQAGNTLALLGGPIQFTGGNVTAPSGQVVLGSVASPGTVAIAPSPLGLSFDFTAIQGFADIQLLAAASVDVSGSDVSGASNGVSSGSLSVQGRQITLLDGSAFLAVVLGEGQGQTVDIRATEELRLSGFASDPIFGEPIFLSSIAAEVALDATGQGGDIRLVAPRIQLDRGAAISTSTNGLGNAGNLTVDAQQVLLLGANPLSPSALGSVVGFTSTGQGGDVQIVAQELIGADGGSLSTFAFGPGQAGRISLDVDRIQIRGGSAITGPSGFFAGSVLGEGGAIAIQAQTLEALDGAQISASAFGPGNGGEIAIAAENIRLDGTSPSGAPSGLFTSVETSEASGQAGDIRLSVGALDVTAGARLAAGTSGTGDGGILTLEGGTVRLSGTAPDGRASGLFSTVEPSSSGNAGSIVLNVEQLEAEAGAQVVVGTAGAGDAGTLQLTANRVLLSGSSDFGLSGLIASAIVGSGAGGNIDITADEIVVADEATINASNFGTNASIPVGQGPAGNITIRAESLQISDGGTLTTATAGGDRGNIDLQIQLISLRRAAGISANALNQATGGNITIDSAFITAVPAENSDITANAEQAQGGQILVTAQGLFGTEFSEVLTPNSEITASSEIGLNGTVQITQLNRLEPIEGIELTEDFGAPEDQIVAGCPAQSEANFVASGRGGLPDGPQQILEDAFVLNGLETEFKTEFKTELETGFNTIPPPPLSPTPRSQNILQRGRRLLQEAQTWRHNIQGRVELVAHTPSAALRNHPPSCLKEVG